MSEEIARLEAEIFRLTGQLNELKAIQPGNQEVPDYLFETQHGSVHLGDLFGEHEKLLVIHNMGQACRYCTMWADGLNGLVPHLESALAVVLVSRDSPETQRRFAQNRGWRFRMASHGAGDYIREQSVMPGQENMPGAVVYQKSGDKILRLNACVFGPNDLYCAAWPLLAMAGFNVSDWTPQFRYWTPPGELDDGGENFRD